MELDCSLVNVTTKEQVVNLLSNHKINLILIDCDTYRPINFNILEFIQNINKNTYCLSFGLIFLGVAIGIYALNKSDGFDQILRELMEEREQAKPDDIFLHKEINRLGKKIKKQKRFMSFSFFICAFLLIVMAFVNMA